jgi:hypothetical protein
MKTEASWTAATTRKRQENSIKMVLLKWFVRSVGG